MGTHNWKDNKTLQEFSVCDIWTSTNVCLSRSVFLLRGLLQDYRSHLNSYSPTVPFYWWRGRTGRAGDGGKGMDMDILVLKTLICPAHTRSLPFCGVLASSSLAFLHCNFPFLPGFPTSSLRKWYTSSDSVRRSYCFILDQESLILLKTEGFGRSRTLLEILICIFYINL